MRVERVRRRAAPGDARRQRRLHVSTERPQERVAAAAASSAPSTVRSASSEIQVRWISYWRHASAGEARRRRHAGQPPVCAWIVLSSAAVLGGCGRRLKTGGAGASTQTASARRRRRRRRRPRRRRRLPIRVAAGGKRCGWMRSLSTAAASSEQRGEGWPGERGMAWVRDGVVTAAAHLHAFEQLGAHQNGTRQTRRTTLLASASSEERRRQQSPERRSEATAERSQLVAGGTGVTGSGPPDPRWVLRKTKPPTYLAA